MNPRLGPLCSVGKVLVALVVGIGMAASVAGVSGARPASASPLPDDGHVSVHHYGCARGPVAPPGHDDSPVRPGVR